MATVALCSPSAVLAQASASDAPANQIETVIVTAQKRAEDIQDVPISISAFSGEQLLQQGISTAADLQTKIPSLNIAGTSGSRSTRLQIRGIGSSGSNLGIDPSVGLFVDGVLVPMNAAILGSLIDVSSIEVLRGPQGTLYGRNTPVGAINISTNAPTRTITGGVSAELGNYDRYQVSGYISGPITENVSGRLMAYANSRDGYEKNLFDGKRTNDSAEWGVRGRLRWWAGENTTVDLIGYYTDIHTHCCSAEQIDASGPGGIATPGFLAASAALGTPFRNFDDDDHVVDDSSRPNAHTILQSVTAEVNHELWGGHTLTSITAYGVYRDIASRLVNAMLPQAVILPSQTFRTSNLSEELRIASPSDQRLEYVGGLYLLYGELNYSQYTTFAAGANRLFPLPPQAGGPQTLRVGDSQHSIFKTFTHSAAAFGQATYHVNDSFRLTGGLRYAYDEKRSAKYNVIFGLFRPPSPVLALSVGPPQSVPRISRIDRSLTWLAGAQYDISPTAMVYFTSGSGFKNGGASSTDGGTFDPEKSTTFELGIKSTFLDRRLLINANVFRMKLKDFQESSLNPATGFNFLTINAGDRRVQGVEANSEFRATEYLTLTGDLTYTDATFTSYPAGPCISTFPSAAPPTGRPPAGAPQPNPARPGACDYTGFRPSDSPRWRWNIGAQWDQPLPGGSMHWFVAADASHISSRFLDVSLDPRGFVGSETTVNARLGVRAEDNGWRVWLWARNLTDEAYYAATAPQPAGGLISAGGPFSANGYVGFYAPPRTYGIEATYKF